MMDAKKSDYGSIQLVAVYRRQAAPQQETWSGACAHGIYPTVCEWLVRTIRQHECVEVGSVQVERGWRSIRIDEHNSGARKRRIKRHTRSLNSASWPIFSLVYLHFCLCMSTKTDTPNRSQNCGFAYIRHTHKHTYGWFTSTHLSDTFSSSMRVVQR